MCSSWSIEVVRRALPEFEAQGKTVVEVGSYDVNGSVRPHIEALGPSKYLGVDMRMGPGVDVVCNATDLVERFGPNAFDVLISTELLEHARDWRAVVHNFKTVVRPRGLLIVSARSYGVDFHREPFDFWRYEKADFETIFSDLTVEELTLDPTDPGLFIKARKPESFLERDLSEHRLYSILRQKKKRETTGTDIVLFHLRYRFIRLFMDLLPKRYRRAVHERLLR